MTASNNKFYITTAIYYANAGPHIGHALEKVQSDAIARYHRSLGKEVFFLTGTDEYGTKILRSAEAQNKDPKDFVTENANSFKKLIKDLDISVDEFIRTTDQEKHWPGAQALWNKIVEAGDIYKAEYEGHYCVGCEAFVRLGDLIDGKCSAHDKEPELIKEENYFFKLSRYADKVKEKIESGELKISPSSRKNEMLAMFKAGIEDISFSRSVKKLSWGVPVPNDDSQIMYVWCDALANYISALGYGREDDNFKKFWPADLHVVGKDILRFHAIIWPAMLMSAGLPLPKQLFVHGFITSEGKKMSKSIGNVVDPNDLIERYGKDALRYYLLREITPFEDGDITEEKFKEAYNANLANGLGNLVSRVMKMAENHLNQESGIMNQESGNQLRDSVSKWMEGLEMNKAMDEIWKKISELDLKIQETQPFKLIKTDEEKAKNILRELVAGLSQIAEALTPFLPETSEKILDAIQKNKMPEPLFLRKE